MTEGLTNNTKAAQGVYFSHHHLTQLPIFPEREKWTLLVSPSVTKWLQRSKKCLVFHANVRCLLDHLSKTASSEPRNRSRHSTGNDSVHLEAFSVETLAPDYWFVLCCCCPVAKSCLTLWLHGLQHARLPCPSVSTGVCSNSCPSSWWRYPTISSSVIPFSFCPQSFPASGSFPMSQLFTSSDQSIGASASALVLPINIQSWFPLGLTGLIFLLSKGLWIVFSSTRVGKH